MMKIRIAIAFLLAVSGIALDAAPDVTAQEALERFLRSDRGVPTTYRAYRRLEASTRGGRMEASLEAWTYVDANGRFGFEITREEGSSLIRNRVLRKALETERDNVNRRETRQVELTPANYEFRAAGAGADTATIGIKARRTDPLLLNGTVMVTREHGDIIRLDGELSETPSWWTRRVQISRRYEAIDGVRVPVEMSSKADIRVVGESFFAMTYRYMEINGRRVE